MRFGRFRVARSGEVLRWGMDVLKIESSIQICEVTHDLERSLMRVRFKTNGRPQEGYLEFVEVPRSVYDQFCQIEDSARRDGHRFGKAEKPQNIARYYQGTLRALFSGVRVLANGGRRPLE